MSDYQIENGMWRITFPESPSEKIHIWNVRVSKFVSENLKTWSLSCDLTLTHFPTMMNCSHQVSWFLIFPQPLEGKGCCLDNWILNLDLWVSNEKAFLEPMVMGINKSPGVINSHGGKPSSYLQMQWATMKTFIFLAFLRAAGESL